MLGNYFYHKSISKTVIAFGTLFNNIQIRHNDEQGNTSFGFALGGGATKTQSWTSFAFKPSSFTTPTNASITWNNAANTALTPNSTNTNAHAFIKGTIRVTVKGTVIPQVSLGSAAAAVVQTNSYFKIYSVGSATTAFSGYWL